MLRRIVLPNGANKSTAAADDGNNCTRRDWTAVSANYQHKYQASLILTSSAGLHASSHVNRVAEQTVARHDVAHDARHHWS